MSHHTPTPWREFSTTLICPDLGDGKVGPAIASAATNYPIRYDTAVANAARIVACVNACAGMIDPATYIPDLQGSVIALANQNAALGRANAQLTTALAEARNERAGLYD